MHRLPHQDHAEGPAVPSSHADFVPIAVRIAVAVRMTGIGRSKIYELIASGDIEIVKIGSSTLILVESLHALLARNKR